MELIATAPNITPVKTKSQTFDLWIRQNLEEISKHISYTLADHGDL